MSDTDLRPRPTADRRNDASTSRSHRRGGSSRRMLKFWLTATGTILVAIAVLAAIGIATSVDGQFRTPPSTTLVWEYVLLMDAVALMAFGFGAAYLLESGRTADESESNGTDTETGSAG